MKSVDSGGTWSPASNGLGAFPQQGIGVSTLAMDPKTPTTLYTFEYTSFEFYKTTDGAANWMPTSLKEDVYALTVDPVEPSVIYAGRFGAFDYGRDVLIKSTDGATSWAEAQTGLPFPGSVNAIAIDPHNHSTIYAGTGRGVFKSTDSASTWKTTDCSFCTGPVFALVIDPSNSANIYASTGESVYRSTDSGATWTSISSGLETVGAGSLAIDPTGRVLYAATNGGVFSYEITLGPIDLAVDPDGATRVLSVDGDNPRVVLERVDIGGNISKVGPFGPYSAWTPTATAAGSDFTRILWTHDDGSASLWLVNPSGVPASFPYSSLSGRRAIDVAASGSTTHILWTGADGSAEIQAIDGSEAVTKTFAWGPYPGWHATAISDGPDGLTRILWNKSDGTAGVSVVSPDGSFATTRYGPAAGWTALDIAVGGDGVTRVLWANENGRFVLAILDAAGQLVKYGPIYNASDAAPLRLACGPGGSSRILFTGTDGRCFFWILNSDGVFSSEVTLSFPGEQFDISGSWNGLYKTNDPGDCTDDPDATAGFNQFGSDVNGAIYTVPSTCGFGGNFTGKLNGSQLTGTLNGGLAVSGTVSTSAIHLSFGNGHQVPGGTLDLHR
jgi:hypothetical protein